MDIKNDAFSDLSLPESRAREAIFVYLKIIFLPVLAYLPFVLGYAKIINFNVGLHTLIMMGLILFIALIFARHSAELGCCLFEQRQDIFKRELKNFIIKNLLSIGNERKSNASFDDFVSEYSKDVRNENYASIGSSIFPMLGILGTFISIAISLPSFSSSSNTGLENEIVILLNGVGTAFYVSIYGIFLALWWIFFEKFGMSRFERLSNRMRNYTSSFFWSKEDIEQRYLSQSLKHFEKIGVIFDYVSNQEFFEELNRSVERKFQIFSNILNMEESSIKLSSEQIKQTMDTLLKTQRDQKDLTRIHSEILNVLHQFNSNISDMQLRFTEQYVRLADINNEKLTKIGRIIGEFEASAAKMEYSMKKFASDILQKQQENLQAFEKSLVSGMNAFKDVFDEEGQNIYKRADEKNQDYKEEAKKLDSEVESLLENINKINNFESK